MPLFKRPPSRHNHPENWRDFQSSLSKSRLKRGVFRPRQRYPRRKIFSIMILLTFLLGSAPLILNTKSWAPSLAAPPSTPRLKPTSQLDKEGIRQLLSERLFSNLSERELTVDSEGSLLHIETTLNPNLQKYLLETIDKVNSRYVGIVVMEGKSGEILAMAGYDRTDSHGNPCLRSQFPAASIFKIVTAATAIDHCGYTAETPMHYNGPKHTLYKRQLTDRVDRNTTTIPLREAFADSINPVFGKLGELRLRKPLLEQAAVTFGFNQSLDVDVILPPSQFKITDKPYNWAEVASGFNKETTLSPLHGAAVASAVINNGRMLTPILVNRVADDQKNILYQRPLSPEFKEIMSPHAASALKEMMEETIISGTARKIFRKHEKDRVLSQLQIGGKTGSIDNTSHDVRYDWFVGYAKERHGQRSLIISVLVGHEKFIGIRASDYARRAMTYYFDESPR